MQKNRRPASRRAVIVFKIAVLGLAALFSACVSVRSQTRGESSPESQAEIRRRVEAPNNESTQGGGVEDLRRKGVEIALQEASGRIPVFYEPGNRETALRSQKALEEGVDWYEKRLHVAAPMALFVIDDGPARKVLGVRDGAHSYFADRPAFVFVSTQQEALMFHEAGHIFASALKLPTQGVLSELMAQFFAAAYNQRDSAAPSAVCNVVWQQGRIPRYTRWEDLEILNSPDLQGESRYWFQAQLSRISCEMLRNQSMVEIVKGFQKEFATDGPAPVDVPIAHPSDIKAALKRISPSFDQDDPLFGPTTLPLATPSMCEESTPSKNFSLLAIRNDRNEPITLSGIGFILGRPAPPITIGARAWYRLTPVGATYKLPNGLCIAVREEPAIAVVKD